MVTTCLSASTVRVLSRPVSAVRLRWRALLSETLLLVALLGLYSGARLLAAQNVAPAFGNASRVLHVERWLHLPREQALQALLLTHDVLARAANRYYAYAHLTVTGLTLAWLFLHRPEHYRRARRALVAATTAALGFYLLLPVAPPRMLGGLGFVDVAEVHGQSVYASTSGRTLTDQYAAMPSLHVGWSVLIAVVCISAAHTRWRWLWVLHPLVTAYVVVATGNHYWLDGIVGVVLVATALVVTRPRPQAPPAVTAVVPAQRAEELAVR